MHKFFHDLIKNWQYLKVPFRQEWYSEEQLQNLVNTYQLIRQLEGAVVEIGCWEGKSTVALANACYPETLIAVDHWLGNIEEDRKHLTVQILKNTDVFLRFKRNIQLLTKGNVEIVKRDCFEFLSSVQQKIKFCHIDACHDYFSVKKTIELLLPKMVGQSIICGDDYQTAHKERKDLNGGVQQAVMDLLKGHQHIKNFWYWQK